MSVGRDYAVNVTGIAVSAAVDLDEIVAADDKPVQIIGSELAQSTDFGDAQDEILRIALRRGDSVSGSGGTSPTVRALQYHDAAAGLTAEGDNTTKANTSGIALLNMGWNVRVTGPQWWPDGFGPSNDQTGSLRICRELVAAPADSITIEQALYVREF